MAVDRYTRKDGSTVYLSLYFDPEGKRRKEKAKGCTVPADATAREHKRAREKAQVFASERRAQVENGTWAPPNDHVAATLPAHKLFDRFMLDYRGKRGKNRGQRPGDYYVQAVTMLKAHFPNKPLRAITERDVQRFADKRAEMVSASTVRRNLTALGTILGWAKKRKLIGINPVDEIEKPAERPSDSRDLTPDERERLRKACSTPLRLCVEWMIGSGMDRGEVLNLTWADVNLADGYAWAPRDKTGTARRVYLNAELRAVLKQSKSVRSVTHPHVFLDRRGKPWAVEGFKTALRRAWDQAEIPVGKPAKTLRHCFASDLARRGVPTKVIAELMGHTETTITNRYMHVGPNDLAAAMAQLDLTGGVTGAEVDQSAEKVESCK